MDTAAPTVVENPLQNSTSRRWFALEQLCQAMGQKAPCTASRVASFQGWNDTSHKLIPSPH